MSSRLNRQVQSVKKHRKVRSKKSKNLQASGWLNPQNWDISLEEAAYALKMPVEKIVKVRNLKYQVIVVYLNADNKKCCSFFSYRLFERWHTEVINVILSCNDDEELAKLGDIVQYEIENFPYTKAQSNYIWETLIDQISMIAIALGLKQQAA
ncbi:MAG TPA: hypothetical protein V6C58_18005 [Allocoleopsis sp.]